MLAVRIRESEAYSTLRGLSITRLISFQGCRVPLIGHAGRHQGEGSASWLRVMARSATLISNDPFVDIGRAKAVKQFTCGAATGNQGAPLLDAISAISTCQRVTRCKKDMLNLPCPSISPFFQSRPGCLRSIEKGRLID